MLLFAESFEHYGTAPNGGRDNMLAGAWANFIVAGGISISAAQSRTGSKSLNFNPGFSAAVQEARFALGSVETTCGMGVGIYLANLPVSNQLCGVQFRDNTNAPIVTFCWQSDGSICARAGSHTGAIIDITDSVLVAGTFNYFEAKAVIDDVAGEIEIHINGVTKLMLGSLDLGTVGCSQMTLNAFNEGGSPAMYWDDLFAWNDAGAYNNDFSGPQRILTIYPTGDTAQADFLLNGAGTGFGCINQTAPDGDATYIGSDTVGDKSDFSLPALPTEILTIAGVYVPAMAKLDAAGVGNMKVSMVSGGTPLAGSDDPLTTGYTYYKSVFEYDPDTAAAWTKTGLEAALLRVEKTA